MPSRWISRPIKLTQFRSSSIYLQARGANPLLSVPRCRLRALAAELRETRRALSSHARALPSLILSSRSHLRLFFSAAAPTLAASSL